MNRCVNLRKNSFISRLFAILCVILVGVAVFMNFSIYRYSKEIISNEIITLNSVVLSHVSEAISLSIADIINLANKIAYDNQTIENLKDADGAENLDRYMDDLIINYTWSRNRQRNLLETYVVGYNDISYGNPVILEDYKDIRNDPIYKDAFNESGEAILLNTFFNQEGQGIYRYSFQIAKEIRDHLSGEPYGVVLLNVSENVLHHTYNDLYNINNDVFIVDEDGEIISHKDKRLINNNYFEQMGIKNYPNIQSGHIEIEGKDGTLALFNRLKGTNWYVVEEIKLEQVLQPIESIKDFIVLNTIISVAVFIFVSRYFANRTSEPIARIKDKMELVTQGDLTVRAEVENNDEFGEIANSFNEMVGQIQSLLLTVKEEENRKRLVELDFLRAQINPHFIYNTLSSIRFYVEMHKNKEAEEMLYLFSRILRKTLTRSDQFTTIEDEINITKDYIELQKLRYTDSFEVIYNISEEILDYMIPNFILQPVVENSIFYGVSQQVDGFIRISGEQIGDTIEIVIEDNGKGMSKEEISKVFHKEPQMNKVGLINVHERIQLNYGMAYGLKIVSEEDQGTQVIFRLPISKLSGEDMKVDTDADN